MKSRFYLAMITLLIVNPCFANDLKTNDWGPATNNLRMSIKLKDGESNRKTNDPIDLTIVYTNISTNQTFYLHTFNQIELDASYSFLVITPSGKRISSQQDGFFDGSGGIHPLPPLHEIEFHRSLSKLFQFDETGVYTIRARYVIGQPNSPGFLIDSNPLKVEIVPDK